MSNRAERRQGNRLAAAEAAKIAHQLASGRLDAADLERQTAEESRKLFGTVVGPGDPLWDLQVEVARRVLALSGLPASELGEWTAVALASEAERDSDAAGADDDVLPDSLLSVDSGRVSEAVDGAAGDGGAGGQIDAE